MTPFFSVIITTYNRPDKLIRAIDSVLSQEFQDFELIIVNDGSTADYDIVNKHIKDKEKIHYFYKQNEERSVARNFGVNKSTGTFICFLDDDDYYFNNHLSVLRKAIEQNNFKPAIYHTYSNVIDKNGINVKMPICEKKANISEFQYYLTDGIMTMNNTCMHIIILRKFPFDTNLYLAEDHHQRLRAMSEYDVIRINEYTTVYDKSEETTTNNMTYKKNCHYIYSFKTISKLPFIKKNVKRIIRKTILAKYYRFIANDHRNEISFLKLLTVLIRMTLLKPTFENLIFSAKAIIWKFQNR